MADFSTVARPYARALFDLANAADSLAQWSTALSRAAGIVADDEVRQFLARPELLAAQRAEFLQSVCGRIDDAGVLATAEGWNFLRLLAEYGRLPALPEISAQFDDLKSQAENRVKVTLVSANEVGAELSTKVRLALQERLGRSVELAYEVDRVAQKPFAAAGRVVGRLRGIETWRHLKHLKSAI